METLVLVLTDVQGSTRLWQDEPVAMDVAMARHHEIVHRAVQVHGGWRPVDQGEGDAVFAAFRSASGAVAAVAQVQRELAAERWPTGAALRVRVGVHVGEVTERAGNLYGDPVNRCARLRGLGSGGQTLLSAAVYEVVRDALPAGASVRDLGEHRMKDLTRPEHVWQLDLDGLVTDFPPLASLDRVRHNLPVQATAFIGREAELRQLVAALHEHRLVTLTGFGGMGKTRTALQAAAELVGDPVVGEVLFVDLSGVQDSRDVPARVAEAAGTVYDDDPQGSLLTVWASTPVLLVLDNLEQVLGCAPFIAALLSGTSGVRVLATSREALRLRAEQVIALQPMTAPSPGDGTDVAALDTFEAVRFFVDRARAVRQDFVVTNDNAPAVAAVCARLDGHPLALELAAARLRMISVESLQARLDTALKVLTGGSRDMPERHQTLRATIGWSYDSLEPDERLLLARMSALPAAADFELVEAACGDGLDVFSSLEILVDRSLVQTRDDESGQTRYGLLVSIRDYAHEHLDPTADAHVRQLHATHLQALIAATMDEHPLSEAAIVRAHLPHLRAALTQLAATDPNRYIQLGGNVADGLVQGGFDVESLQHTRAALALDPAPAPRTKPLTSLHDATNYPPDALPGLLEAARASGRPDLLADALTMAAAGATTTQSLQTAVTELDQVLPHLGTETASRITSDLLNALGGRLRNTDPALACSRLRAYLAASDAGEHGILRVRLTRILIDHGLLTEADALMNHPDNLSTVDGSVWLAFAQSGRLLSLATARRYVDVVDAVTVALTVPGPAYAHASLTWRRGHAHLHLGHTDLCRQDLTAARHALAADELNGPRELLGCLVTEALLLHQQDPAHAAALLGSIEGHRTTNLGRWVLPHNTQTIVDDLEKLLLPTHQDAYLQGRRMTPPEMVHAHPLPQAPDNG